MPKRIQTLALCTFSCIAFHSYALNQSSTTKSEHQTMHTEQHTLSLAEQNKIAGQSFLEQNKKKPGVITLPDGLQYKIITEGKGSKPKDSDTVTVNYAGTLINGKEFDSSYKRGQPASFPVNMVIPGWTEALKLMPQGSTWELYIPSNLAYGEQGAGTLIGPNETLIFKVELIGIQ